MPKAIRALATGGPEQLELVDFKKPEPGPDEVFVRVEAAGVNYIDVYHRTGFYPVPLPIQLGLEGAGTVKHLGKNVSTLKEGARVVWTGIPGSYATHVLVPADRAVPLPDDIDFKVAAAVFLQGLTAHYLSHSTFALKAGHTALVHAAAGGVGLLLVQIAKHLGARVIGTTSTEEKAALAKKAGADEVILYTQNDFQEATLALTQGRGVDVVYDAVGKTTFEKSLGSLAPRGHLVLYGQASGPVGSFDTQLLAKGSYSLTRPSIVHYTATREELLERATQLFTWIREGTLDVRIDREFPLAEAAEAHRALEARQTTGKLLLIP